MALLKFLKGNYSSLNNAAIAEGQILICNDTAEMFVDVAADKRIKIGDFTVVANIAALEALDATSVPTSRLYYVEDGNILARSNGTDWIQVNKQPSIEDLKVNLGLGSAAYTDATAYDAAGSAKAVRDYVGEIPTGYTEETIIAYINKKAEETLNSASGGSSESAASVLAALNTYKSENDPKVTANTNAIAAIKDGESVDSFADVESALAGKQDVIAENTYDAYGAAAQALTDAKAYVDEEDIFDVDMDVVSALGGIKVGDNFKGKTTHYILNKLLYPYVDASVGNATASPNGGTYEKGTTKTITQVSISVTKKSEPITSVALYNGSTLIEEKTGDAVKNGGTITFSGLSVEVPTNGNQLTVKVTYPDANGNAKTVEKKTTAMSFVYPYYIGTCAAGTTIDETLVESLTKKIEGKGNKSNSFTVSDGHMVFAYPNDPNNKYGSLKSILDPNNFETIGNYTVHTVDVTGLDGKTIPYLVYVSGATTVSGFAVNFKY